MRLADRQGLQRRDEILIIAVGLFAGLGEAGENDFHTVDGRQNQRDGLRCRHRAITQFADQTFRSVSEEFEPREAEKTASSLDRVEQTEDADDGAAIGGIAFKQNKLFASGVDLLVGFDNENR